MSKRRLTLVIIIAELLAWYVVLNDGAWVYDDNLIMSMARRSGLSWDWLTGLIFQHWGLGYHALFSLLQRAMPVDYRWALVLMLAQLGGSIYLVQRIVSLLFGRGWLAVGAAAYFGISILFVPALRWGAAGLAYLPNTFFDLLCLFGFVHFQVDRRRLWVAVSGIGLAAGLLFYEKPAFMLLYLALAQVLFLAGTSRPRAIARLFWRDREMWACLIAIEIIWAIGFRLSGGGVGVAAGTVSLHQYLDYFRILWAQALVPAMFGLTLPAADLSSGQVIIAAALQAALIALVVLSIWRKRSAWRAWAFLAVIVLVTGGLVARTRIAIFGVGVGGDLRYLFDFAWLVPLVLCFAFVPERWAVLRADSPSECLSVPGRWLYAGIAALFLVAYATASIATNAKLEREWPAAQARAWERNASRATAGAVIADNLVPPYIVASAFSGYDRLSSVLPFYAPGVRVDGVLDRPLEMIDANGVVRRPGFWRIAAIGVPGDESCVGSRADARQVVLRVPRRITGTLAPYYLLVSYRSSRPGSVGVFVDSGQGFPAVTDRRLSVARGTARSIVFLDSKTPRRLLIELAAGQRLCSIRMDVVAVHPL